MCFNDIDSDIQYICKNEYEYFLNKKNVVGVGLGYKFTKGFFTRQKCITVFVCKKESTNILNVNDVVPQIYKGICTDILESGMLYSYSLTKMVRPAIPGYSIGNSVYTRRGTLGCLVTDGHEYYILSNNHVLCNCNQLPLETDIIQPAKMDGGDPKKDVIAELYQFIPLKFITKVHRPVNSVDCAIANVVNRNKVSNKIAFVGEIKGLVPPKLDELVKKVGATTELTKGKITNVCSTIIFGYPKVSKSVLFQNQIITTGMSEPGDSGSVLLDNFNRAVGLLVGGNNKINIYNSMANVLNALKVTFA